MLGYYGLIHSINKLRDIFKFDEIFILSGTILEPRRKEVINYLKDPKYKKILLITTYISPQKNRAVKNRSYFYNCYGKEKEYYIENQG